MRDILEILKDYPTLKHQYDQILSMNYIKSILPGNLEEQSEKLKQDFEKFIFEIDDYNINFSDNGWIAYKNINMPFLEQANGIFYKEGIEKAEEFIVNYYIDNSEEIKKDIIRSSNEFKIRLHIIEIAFEDLKNERYCSAIILFLTIADGVINDFTKNKGFFTDNINLDCWDCLVDCDKGLKKIKDIYNTSRKKTTIEEIRLPYRNGILHGRDLNFGNKFVAAKCLVLLLAISEWISDKKSEVNRIEKYNMDINPPTLEESINTLKDIKEDNKLIKNWKSDNILIGKDIPKKGKKEEYTKYDFIYEIIETLELWKNKNYGDLTIKLEKLFNNESNIKLRPKRCRELFEKNKLLNFELVNIIEKSICLKIVEIKVDIQKENKIVTGVLRFGLIYEGKDYMLAIPPKKNGTWKIYPQDVRILY